MSDKLVSPNLTQLLFYTSNISIELFVGEYSQNLCRQGDTTCKPCPERHPSCVGLPDGRNAMLPWTDHYVVCLKNRTVSTGRCASGVFNPVERLCIVNLHPGILNVLFEFVKRIFMLCQMLKKL